jgi:hypothetical protein
MVTTLKYGSQKDSINKLLKRLSNKTTRGFDAHKYSGSIMLKKDPLETQKELRNEWE